MRCKMTINSILRHVSSVPLVGDDGVPLRGPDGRVTTTTGKAVEVSMTPVYANGDLNHENSKFWAATPSGSLKLTVPERAVAGLDVGDEVYVDISKA